MKSSSNYILKKAVSTRSMLGVVILLLLLSFIPYQGGPLLEGLIHRAGVGWAQDAAREYLKVQKEQSLEGFLILSGLKVGLAVLKSSEIGLILNVRVGDLAVAVYDYVDFGWKVLLAAVAYYNIAEFLLDLAGSVDIWFVWIGLVCFGLVWVVSIFAGRPWIAGPFFRKTGMAAFAFALILYLGLPLAFVGAGWVSMHITGGTIRDSNRFFTELESDMPRIFGEDTGGNSGGTRIRTPSVTVPFPQNGSDQSEVISNGPGTGKEQSQSRNGTGLKDKLRDLRDYLETRSRSLASAVLRQTAAYLFNIVVFPLLTLALLYWSGRYIISWSTPLPRPTQDPVFSENVRRLSEAALRLERAANRFSGRHELPGDSGPGPS